MGPNRTHQTLAAPGRGTPGFPGAPLSGEVVSRPRTRPVRVDDDPSPDDVERFNNVTQTCPHCKGSVRRRGCLLPLRPGGRGGGVGRKAALWILVVVVVLVAGFVLARCCDRGRHAGPFGRPLKLLDCAVVAQLDRAAVSKPQVVGSNPPAAFLVKRTAVAAEGGRSRRACPLRSAYVRRFEPSGTGPARLAEHAAAAGGRGDRNADDAAGGRSGDLRRARRTHREGGRAAGARGRSTRLIKDAMTTALKLIPDRRNTGELKLITTAIKELRYAYRVFGAHPTHRSRSSARRAQTTRTTSRRRSSGA